MKITLYSLIVFVYLFIVIWRGWQVEPGDAKVSEKCPCSHNSNTALIKINIPVSALVMTNTQGLDKKNPFVGQNRDMAHLAPPKYN